MKIQEITTKDGTKVPVGKFTVLVGPNNVGKSQTLKDIHQKLTNGPSARATILESVQLEKPTSFDVLLDGLTVIKDPDNIDHHLVRGIGSNLASGENIRVQLESLKQQFQTSENLDFTFGNISKFRVSYLDAESRLNVTKVTKSHNPHIGPPQNLLQGLFEAGQTIEGKLQKAFKETFGLDVRLDYSGMTQLALRIAKEFGEVPSDPRDAYPVFSKFNRLDEQGDGFRSFVGVVLSLLLSENRIVLLDEPEAFLHPAQARQLGYWIANRISNQKGQVLVATHNASFLSGILASNNEVEIFRINRTDDVTRYIHIPSTATSSLATSPILSSQRVLEAIFYRGVIVCEADADRSVYQSVATRELQDQDVLFVHAHNKQTIPQVTRLLRDAQIPTCAVADLDVINSSDDLQTLITSLGGNENLKIILSLRDEVAAGLGQFDEDGTLKNISERVKELHSQLVANEHNLSGVRGALNRIRKEATNWYPVKLEGVSGFPDDVRNLATRLIEQCESASLFLVPVGELEGWMDLGTRRKNSWIVLALEKLHEGNCPAPLRSFVEKIINQIDNLAANKELNMMPGNSSDLDGDETVDHAG